MKMDIDEINHELNQIQLVGDDYDFEFDSFVRSEFESMLDQIQNFLEEYSNLDEEKYVVIIQNILNTLTKKWWWTEDNSYTNIATCVITDDNTHSQEARDVFTYIIDGISDLYPSSQTSNNN